MGSFVARARTSILRFPLLPGLNQNVTAAVLAGGIGLAQSFDKDHFNGRDTFSTNPGPVVAVDSGVITTASFPATVINNGFPVQIASTSHGLATGDRVQISGVSNNPNANGVFTVTVQDPDHFTLDGSSGGFTGTGGTWTKLVQTTRDPQMRVVLPKAANGTDLKNSPWFIRVRSEPAQPLSASRATHSIPGLTSGQYQLQVRIQQQDQKPASTVQASPTFAMRPTELRSTACHSTRRWPAKRPKPTRPMAARETMSKPAPSSSAIC